MGKIFLSVIIPLYNTKEAYFKGCLDSLRCQHSDEIEIIVVDDGSKDEYSGIAQRLLKESKLDYQYYKKENGGQNSARQLGVDKACGEYIYFVDSDDCVRKQEVNEVIEILKKNHPAILGVNMEILDGNDNLIDKIYNWNGDYQKTSLKYALLHNASLYGQVYKREIFNQVSLIQGTKIGEDLASSLLILSIVKEEYSIDKTIYQYIVREKSVITSPPKGSELDIIESFDVLLNKIDKDFLNEYHTEFEWLAIKYVLIDGSHRIYQSFNGNKDCLNKIESWLNNNFPNWKNNDYLKESKWNNPTILKIKVRGFVTKLKKYVK